MNKEEGCTYRAIAAARSVLFWLMVASLLVWFGGCATTLAVALDQNDYVRWEWELHYCSVTLVYGLLPFIGIVLVIFLLGACYQRFRDTEVAKVAKVTKVTKEEVK
jgi:hypothetical protein